MRKPRRAEEAAIWVAYKKAIIDAANANSQSLRGCGVEKLRSVITEHDIVYAVWVDPVEEHGVGTLILKGVALMRDVIANDRRKTVRMTAFSCRSAKEAMALRITLGEPDQTH